MFIIVLKCIFTGTKYDLMNWYVILYYQGLRTKVCYTSSILKEIQREDAIVCLCDIEYNQQYSSHRCIQITGYSFGVPFIPMTVSQWRMENGLTLELPR